MSFVRKIVLTVSVKPKAFSVLNVLWDTSSIPYQTVFLALQIVKPARVQAFVQLAWQVTLSYLHHPNASNRLTIANISTKTLEFADNVLSDTKKSINNAKFRSLRSTINSLLVPRINTIRISDATMFKPLSSIAFNTMNCIVQSVRMVTSLTTLRIPLFKFVLDAKSKDA